MRAASGGEVARDRDGLPGLVTLVVCLVVAGWGMIFTLGVNDAARLGELHQGMPIYWVLHGGLLASALTVVVLLGGPLVRALTGSLAQRRISVEGLFLLSACGALVGSVVASVTGQGAIYYEVVAITLTIYSVGRVVTARSRAAAWEQVAQTRAQWGKARLRQPDGQTVEVAVASLKPGDGVAVAAGGLITVDGRVTLGTALVRETSLTGEPYPVAKRPGDAVLAGSYALDGALVVEVTAGSEGRRLDAVLASVEQAQAQPSQLQRKADEISRWFVPAVATISLLTWVGWWPVVGATEALLRAMAVLLVACPCALGLATPLAIFSGMLALSRIGLVAKTGALIDGLSRCDAVVFDKTGTLSEDALTDPQWHWTEAGNSREALVREAVALVERESQHPVAVALSRAAQAADRPLSCDHDPAAESRESPSVAVPRLILRESRLVPGQGVAARLSLAPDDRALPQLRDLPAEFELTLLSEAASPKQRSAQESLGDREAQPSAYRVVVTMDGQRMATVALREVLRPTAQQALTALKQLGIDCRILTGDAAPAWNALEGVTLEVGLTPAEKEARLRAWAAAGRTVLFVGDGVNDAPAMAHATASIAVESGTDLAKATADGVLLGGNLAQIPAAVILARRIQATVQSNFRYALIYNLFGVGLAVAGVLQPLWAVLIMLSSSALVSFRAAHAARLLQENDQLRPPAVGIGMTTTPVLAP